MKTIKNYNSFVNENYKIDESWRQVKTWLQIPSVLFERLLNKIVGFVPQLNFKYDELSAKIDTGIGIGPAIILESEPQKLKLSDIKNTKMKNTLKATGLFKSWNVYLLYNIGERKFNIDDNNRDVIYITKDELKKGDAVYAERVSDNKYNNKDWKDKRKRKDMRRNGVQYSDLEPQMFVVTAIETDEHEKMSVERKERYNKKQTKDLEKLVNNCIKNDDILGYSKSIAGDWSRDPVIAKVVRADRIDLAEKLINGCYDSNEVIDMLEEEYGDREYAMYENVFKEKKMSEDMRTLLTNALQKAKSELLTKK